ncbi:hypothetical protein ACHAW6_010144 [Cyclotella cf. meneghiniana]
MDAVIETYCDVYAINLEERLGIGKEKLTTALSISTFLNPLFDLKPRIVGSGLCLIDNVPRQEWNCFTRCRISLIQSLLQFMIVVWRVNVIVMKSCDNVNIKKVEAQLIEKKKYQPTIAKTESGDLSGEYAGSIKEILLVTYQQGWTPVHARNLVVLWKLVVNGVLGFLVILHHHVLGVRNYLNVIYIDPESGGKRISMLLQKEMLEG